MERPEKPLLRNFSGPRTPFWTRLDLRAAHLKDLDLLLIASAGELACSNGEGLNSCILTRSLLYTFCTPSVHLLYTFCTPSAHSVHSVHLSKCGHAHQTLTEYVIFTSQGGVQQQTSKKLPPPGTLAARRPLRFTARVGDSLAASCLDCLTISYSFCPYWAPS